MKNLTFGRPAGEYLPHINLLRGLAALMVAFYHFSWFNGDRGEFIPKDDIVYKLGEYGFQGVYIFFVISGFVIPLSMYKGHYLLRKAGRFLLKRSVRIEPPYIASILVVIMGAGVLVWGTSYSDMFDLKRFLLHLGYLIPFTDQEWYGIIFWTLAVEFQFYLVMALLFPLLNHSNRLYRYAVLLLFLCGPFLLNDIRYLPLFGPCFVPGFLLFLLKTDKLNVWELLFFLSCSIVMNYFYRDIAVSISTTLAFLFIWQARTDTWVGNRLGDISYSLYLTHGVIGNLFILFHYDPDASLPAKYGLILVTLLLCIASAAVFWLFFEWPSKALSRRIRI